MQTSSVYRAQARQDLQGRWGNVAVATLVLACIAIVLCGFPGILDAYGDMQISWLSTTLSGLTGVITLLLLMPMQYALYTALLQVARGDQGSSVENMLGNFKRNYSSFVSAGCLTYVVVFLLSIITLGIAGVIFSYAYRMVPYLLQDYPSLSAKEAMRTSRSMMKGHKWDLFVLDLSFIGWIILSIFTLGIGVLWVTPYQYTAVAHFYEDLKAEKVVDTDEDETVVEEVEAE